MRRSQSSARARTLFLTTDVIDDDIGMKVFRLEFGVDRLSFESWNFEFTCIFELSDESFDRDEFSLAVEMN